MAWGALVAAGISVVGGMLSKKGGDKARDAQIRAQEDQTRLGREQLEFGKEQYGDWQARFDPAYQRMMNELDQDLTPNYGQIAGDVKSSFQSARGQERRQMQRYGIRPTDGSAGRMEREYGIREAASHVGVRSQARESKRGLKYARLSDVNSMLMGQQGTAAQMLGAGYSNSMNAYGNASNMWGGIANQRYNRGMDNAYGIGQMAGGVDWSGAWNDVRGWFNRSSGGGGGGTYGGA